MSQVRKFRPPNRLKTLALNNGGLTVRAALQKAGEGLIGLRGACEAEIARRVAEIDRLYGPASPDRTFREMGDLYELSSGIIDAAAGTATPYVHRAAHALCDVVDRCETDGQTDWEAIDVHIGAIIMLHQAGDGMPARAADMVLAGLADVFRKRFQDPPAVS